MTPLRLMSRQTFLGWLFLALGVLAFLLALSPVVIGLLSTPRVHADVSLPFLVTGFVVAVFGAVLLPSSGAAPAATKVVNIFAPYVPRIPGMSRVGDPKPVAPATPPAAPPTSPPANDP